ncbi:ASIC3 [Branchiostoma lanceolatum]|uniref:ASIC3 protein n=1 Tax=Branchiostoma lanceolatum TaxID=7740 RepID=A0A8K0EIT5_BRALA|nr:ASIC3 [Branchiostoma lanceolatum]
MSPEDDKESPEQEFAANTSLHGFNRLVISPGNSRVLWVFAILSSYAGFGYMFGSMMHSYLSYDTITDTNLEFVDELTFPAVTICNMNKFDADKLYAVDWSYLSTFLYGIQMDVPTVLLYGVPPDETVNDTLTGVKVEDMVLQKGFNVSWSRMPYCMWRGTTCTQLNYTHSFGHYGNCFTFNADASNPLKQTMQGSGNGLMVIIDVEENYYTESFAVGGNSEVGLKLLVHDQNEPPMMDTQGIALAPGNHAFIAVKQILYENHVPPWGVCQDLQLEYYDTYTLNGCYLECRSKHVVRNCSCRSYDLPDQVTRGELKCNCPVPCSMTSYTTSVSYAGWPNKHTREYVGPSLGMETSYMGDNAVVFSVYYEKLNYQKIRQLKAMDGGQLSSNLGGMMGLFLGASVLSLLEVCEYLLRRLLGFLGRNRRPKKINVKPKEPPKPGADIYK